MKQTAVDFLVDEFKQKLMGDNLPDWVLAIIDQAKAMEKEQIIDALMTSEVELLSWGISAEQYYNETFKSE